MEKGKEYFLKYKQQHFYRFEVIDEDTINVHYAEWKPDGTEETEKLIYENQDRQAAKRIWEYLIDIKYEAFEKSGPRKYSIKYWKERLINGT